MNPVENETQTVSAEPTPVEAEIDATPVEVVEAEAPAPVFLQAEEEPGAEEEFVEEEEEETVTAAAVAAPVFYQTSPVYADEPAGSVDNPNWDYTHADDGGYYITVIQEKNVKQRNGLLLGASVLMLILTVGGWGVSLFQKELGVGAIGNETSLAYLIDEVPMVVDQEEIKKEKDDGGGGGGGGRDEKDPTSKGDLADQTQNPIIRPDVRIYKNDNFELKQPVAATEGNMKFPKLHDRYGDPNSTFSGLSNGQGTGGGQGSGNGQGQGSGFGTGAGSGSGSGYGSGNGDGNGDGFGSGGNRVPPPAAVPKTTPLRIISTPKATYTDEARANNVQGSVRLKITLLASGQVGSIVPITRLPNGLTEKAIAAARMIKFEPKLVNGVPVTVNITRDYTFTIY